MKGQPVVSVLMTAFNREKYIADAIESVLASTFKEFELIIVDDHSSDNTVAIAKRYEAADERLRVYVNEKNLGDYPNRNRAAKYAKGKYLKYLDSDDLIYPHGLAAFVRCMEAYPAAGLGVCSKMVQEDCPFPKLLSNVEAVERHFFNDGFLGCGPSGVIIRREVFEKVGGFSGKRMIGDSELWFKIASQYPTVVLPPALIFWRQHDEQEFSAGIKEGLYLEMNLPMINEFFTASYCPLSGEEKRRIQSYFRKHSSREVIKMALKKGGLKKSYAFKRKLDLNWNDLLFAAFQIKNKITL